MAKLIVEENSQFKKLDAIDADDILSAYGLLKKTLIEETDKLKKEPIETIAKEFMNLIDYVSTQEAKAAMLGEAVNVFAATQGRAKRGIANVVGFFTEVDLFGSKSQSPMSMPVPENYPGPDLLLFNAMGKTGVEVKAQASESHFPLHVGTISVNYLSDLVDKRKMQESYVALIKIIYKIRNFIRAEYSLKRGFILFKTIFYYTGLDIEELERALFEDGDKNKYIDYKVTYSNAKSVKDEKSNVVLSQSAKIEVSFKRNLFNPMNLEDLKKLYRIRINILERYRDKQINEATQFVSEVIKGKNRDYEEWNAFE
jgi:hypothetical protein